MRLFIVAGFLAALLGSTTLAQGKKEPLVAQVKNAIDRGVRYLKENQRPDGRWLESFESRLGGCTALATLALLNAGVPVDEDHVKRGLSYLRGLESTNTYVRALQNLVFVEGAQVEDLARIRANVQWLLEARNFDNGKLTGWGYTMREVGGSSDNSNTQYALLGLWAGKQAGVKIEREIWESIREFYLRTQEVNGGWAYSVQRPLGGPRLTMTTAGLSGLLISGMELNTGREKIGLDGKAVGCGIYEENKPLAKALHWIDTHFSAKDSGDPLNVLYYNLYGLERAGRLTGQRFFGDHDWYREGCQFLVGEQRENGSWHSTQLLEQGNVVPTSFALLFLSKGRTPVLISKLVHGPLQARDVDTDWNNDRNDLRNLVGFCGKELFHKLPLAWQNFDMARAITPQGTDITEDDILEATSELLQSPIIYFNGHKSPLNRFTGSEKKILQRYIDNGGFLFAEACCGSPAFDKGFKELVQELWPDNELVPLDADHSVWKSQFPVKPGDPYKLWGLSLGCKTVLIYSPQDMSCQWESNNTEEGLGKMAFRLGANIVAYATGREPPRPRLTPVDVTGTKDPIDVPRGYLKVAQIRHRGDWQPAPKAMRNLLDKLHKTAGLDVVLKTEEITVDNQRIVDFKFMYMQGRRDFKFDDEELKHLRFNLENGGLLFADACCGKEAFDKAFRAFVKQLLPKENLIRVPLDDELFSKDLNGTVLTADNIECRDGSGAMRKMAPFLEGIKFNGRWVVLYSKYDIGCALERHQSVDCLGYHPDSAVKIAGAALLYTLRP